MPPDHCLAAGLLALVALLAGVRIGRAGYAQGPVTAAWRAGWDPHAALVTEADHADD